MILADSPLFTIEIDYRGEMLTYREPQRQVDVICLFEGRPMIIRRTLSDWWYQNQRRAEKMDSWERAVVLERLLDYCRDHGLADIMVAP